MSVSRNSWSSIAICLATTWPQSFSRLLSVQRPWPTHDRSDLERDCACSVPKLHPTGARQPQLGFAVVFDFLGIRWLGLYRVFAGIALISRRAPVQIRPPQP